jgi:hypothetical protein
MAFVRKWLRLVRMGIEEERVLGGHLAPELAPEGFSLLPDNYVRNLGVEGNLLAHAQLLIAALGGDETSLSRLADALVNTEHHALRDAQSLVAALAPTLGVRPVHYALLAFKHAPDGALAQGPHLGQLKDGKVAFEGFSSRFRLYRFLVIRE